MNNSFSRANASFRAFHSIVLWFFCFDQKMISVSSDCFDVEIEWFVDFPAKLKFIRSESGIPVIWSQKSSFGEKITAQIAATFQNCMVQNWIRKLRIWLHSLVILVPCFLETFVHIHLVYVVICIFKLAMSIEEILSIDRHQSSHLPSVKWACNGNSIENSYGSLWIIILCISLCMKWSISSFHNSIHLLHVNCYTFWTPK